MDYEKEFKNLLSSKNAKVFRPKIGVYPIEILDEPIETVYIDQASKEETPQIKLRIRYKGEEYNWYVGKGKTPKSLYGQLLVLGRDRKKLAGEKIGLMVNSTTNKSGETVNSYTIKEAIEILQVIEEQEVN